MTSYIFLDTLRFFAHHGVGEQETVVGNEFTVSLRLQVDIRRAAETDDVADTVSYADVHTAVKAEMDIPSKLLEHVCRSGNMPTPRRMTDCRITPFTIDTQALPTAKTLHAFCSGAANGLQ